MKPILVTGGAGFIGSHVCKALAQANFLPIAYDHLGNGFTWAVKWGPLIQGDINDKKLLKKTCQEYQVAGVMHFAASTDARQGDEKPLLYYRNNVGGTLTLLEVIKELEIPYFVFSSSCAVYGIPHEVPIDEEHAKHPINLYGKTKLMGEEIATALSKTTSLHAGFLRYFNAAGADPEGDLGESHEPATHLIPILLDVALKKRPNFTLFGSNHETKDGTAVRDYVHVTDLAEAHILTLQHLMKKKETLTLNLGTGKGHSVLELLHAIEKQFHVKIPVKIEAKKAGDPPVLVAKSDRAKKLLGWTPRFSDLKTLLETTWSWQTR